MNLVVLFHSDVGQSILWDRVPFNEIGDAAEEREIELLHISKKHEELLLRLPEGTKAWEAKVGLENAWREATGETPSFVARPARSVSLSYLRVGELLGSLPLPDIKTSAGIVFMETRGVEKMLEEECERLKRSLSDSPSSDIVVKQSIGQGDVFVVKTGRESDQPSFARVARIVQECYRSVIERQVHAAGRGMSALKALNAVLEEHAPGMIADAGLTQGTGRMQRGRG